MTTIITEHIPQPVQETPAKGASIFHRWIKILLHWFLNF